MGWIILGVIVAVLAGWAISAYNRLVPLRMQGRNAWSDIDVQLKRRHDLVPNLVETVKGYASHERETLERVVELRNQAASAGSTKERAEAEGALTGALRQLFALAEAYPDLKANENFTHLQHQLGEIEGVVADARRYYNAVARDYNSQTQMFPTTVIAGMGGFAALEFFEADDAERDAVAVTF